MSTGTRAVDELRDLVRPAVSAVSGKVPEILVAIALVITALAGFALAGAVIDDRTIESNKGVAEAEVLEGSSFSRTLIRFTLAKDNVAVVPELGVFYPRGLEPGQKVAVEYNLAKPDLVRVAGRSAIDGVPTTLAVLAGVWAVFGSLAYWLRRRRAG
ncbi:DUF3592 domain-containing protein [Pseudonocardia sp. TRM90224]|uniref:DUF3592 domain-containing protein n=1 Tax=Pseudonocardia sp. TRM90224 TaxID=2812678 RepID=UPI001E2A413B|nr:DUF3592 domain-containing protein [Pseudonocardia sp. TRM90224]